MNEAEINAAAVDQRRAFDTHSFSPQIPLTHSLPEPSERRPPKPVPFNGLLTNQVLTKLSGSAFSRLLPFLEPVSLASGQRLNACGDYLDFIYFPESAVISHIYFLADGSTAAASLVGNDGTVGLSVIFDSIPNYWVEVILAGTAMRVASEIVKKEFRRGGSLQQLLLDRISARLAEVYQKAVCHSYHDLSKRLATWLLMVHDRANVDELPLTQEMMANYLGARRAAVNAVCTALRQSSIVNSRRWSVTIIDRERLEKAACECYQQSLIPHSDI